MRRFVIAIVLLSGMGSRARAVDPPPVVGGIEGQPLAANADRLVKALEFLGTPLAADSAKELGKASADKDANKIQQVLDKSVLFVVSINPEARVKAAPRGPADAKLQQAGWTPVLIKVVNEAAVKAPLKIASPQSGEVYSGDRRFDKDPKANPKIVERFLELQMFTAQPMTAELSGLGVEYAIALIYSSEAGKREATIGFDAGQGNQDLGFRGEVAVLFDVKPAIKVKLSVTDFDGKPTTGRFTFNDAMGHVYPPQPKRLAPDLFFQKQIYRADGGIVLLPPGELTVEYGRGPEYLLKQQKIKIDGAKNDPLTFKLERWINPMDFGWYNGDHHIHAAGCAHYTNPSEGVLPQDMYLHVKGEGMNVGCCLTWGPCYDYQRQFFEAMPNKLSEPFTVLKYDVEVSGFGSQFFGHVCLLNLRDQTFPGSEGTRNKWPTWTTPLMKWAKAQNAVTGYAHSANGLILDRDIDKDKPKAKAAAGRLLAALDTNNDGNISPDEAKAGRWPLPEPFATIDTNNDGKLSAAELFASHVRVSTKLPNLHIPEMNGIGAQEICVTSAMGVCDFIGAMDTPRIPEWSCWYHIMNCGFPLKVSGETDFPCISGSRVGQGRVYVQLGKTDMVDYAAWCKGIQMGRSYVSDGYAHALDFKVKDVAPGFGEVKLDQAGPVHVTAKVAFGKDVSLGTSIGAPARDGIPIPLGDTRKVELIVNGKVAASKDVPADDKPHQIAFDVNIDKSSWVALRHFPQMHTNPVNVIVGGKPIRASRDSAKWCIGVIEQLWKVRGAEGPPPRISDAERPEAEKTFQKAIDMYKKIAEQSPEGS